MKNSNDYYEEFTVEEVSHIPELSGDDEITDVFSQEEINRLLDSCKKESQRPTMPAPRPDKIFHAPENNEPIEMKNDKK